MSAAISNGQGKGLREQTKPGPLIIEKEEI